MQRRARSRAAVRRREWCVLAVVLLGLVAWLSQPGSLTRQNHLLQDTATRLWPRSAHPDIVIVAIDDRSIEAIGRWPWRRALHAEVVRAVSAMAPRAIGLDVLFNEADDDYPADDHLLARALQDSGRVVLPVHRRTSGPSGAADLPLPALAEAASALGHVHVVVDADGVVRSVNLLEGPESAPWPHFSLALQCADGVPHAECNTRATEREASQPWSTARPEVIPFAQGAMPYTQYSYIDVLRGTISPSAFKDKYVLVGATATGLGDLFAAPVGTPSRRVPGVEMIAHILDGQLSGTHIRPASDLANTVFNLLPVALALLALLWLGPSAALITSGALMVCTLGAAALMPAWLGWQMAPAAALIGLLLAYPLWSWRRLSAAAHFLRLEMQELQREAPSAPLPEETASADFLDRRINAVEHATRRLRNLHHFVSESLQQLPSPTFVCDTHGAVTLANAAAMRYAQERNQPPPQGQLLQTLLADLVARGDHAPALPPNALDWSSLPPQVEATDAQQRNLLVLCKPFTPSTGSGWIVTLVDLTELRRALQQRDQALHFISHDIRSPNASILTLLEMQREYPDPLPADELLARIERYAQTSLDMAESFVRLASAQSQAFRTSALDLVALLQETVDDAWVTARERGVQVTITHAPEAAPCHGDRALLARAITNLVHNAVKFSPAGSTVACAIDERTGHWAVSVSDQGPGIAPEMQHRLFTPFQRLHEGSHPTVQGIGLGLALVQTVVQRHQGSVVVESTLGAGATFTLLLPQPSAALDAS